MRDRKNTENPAYEGPVIDPNNVEFPSVGTMCKAWGVPVQIYRSRLKYGYSQKEALTGKIEIDGQTVPILTGTQTRPVFDYKGVLFVNARVMAEAHGVNYSTYKRRKALGWSLEECLTPEIKPERVPKYGEHCKEPCYDHDGNPFPSKKEMCAAYGVEYKHFQRRITEYGWSLKDALLGRDDIGKKGKTIPVVDPLGVTHASISAMCRAHGVKVSTYRTRVDRDGMTMAQALGIEEQKGG